LRFALQLLRGACAFAAVGGVGRQAALCDLGHSRRWMKSQVMMEQGVEMKVERG